MWKIFLGFAAFALLARLVLPDAFSRLCLTMMVIYLGMAVIAALTILLRTRSRPA